MALTTHPSLPPKLRKEYSYTFTPLCALMARYTVNNFIVINHGYARQLLI